MINDNQQATLYTIITNLLKEIDDVLLNQPQEAVDIKGFINKHLEVFTEFEKQQITEDLDNMKNKYQVVRELVNTANKCLKMLSLPQIEVKWVITIDETESIPTTNSSNQKTVI